MNTQKSSKGFRVIIFLAIGLLLGCNAVLLLFVVKANKTLEKHNEIVLTVPPDLKEKMVSVVRRDAESAVGKCFNSITRKLASIDSQLATNTMVNAYNRTLIQGIVEAPQKRVNEYLTAARNSTNNIAVAQVLYLAALKQSESKYEILVEIVDWQTKMIMSDLASENVEVAFDRLASLNEVCRVELFRGTAEDITSSKKVLDLLSTLEVEINLVRNNVLDKQRSMLAQLNDNIQVCNTYTNAVHIFNSLSELDVLEELDKERSNLLAQIQVKQTYLTEFKDPLLTPEVSENTPWVKWLDNFGCRLQSNLTIEQKINEVAKVSEFLLYAKDIKSDDVQCAVADVEEKIKAVAISYWEKKCDELLSKKDKESDQVNSLLLEAESFPSVVAEANKCRIVALHKAIISNEVMEVNNGIAGLKISEGEVKDENYIQMISVVQGQYSQLLLELYKLESQYAGSFTKEILTVKNQVLALGQKISGYRSNVIKKEMMRINDQQKKYREAVSQIIKSADEKYVEAEKIAATWSATRNNETCIDLYKEAWKMLIEIHPNDLQQVDPAQSYHYSDLKEKIETHIREKLTKEDWCKVNYIRLEDF